MSWNSLLSARRLQQHTTSKQELNELRSVVERDLADAALPGLSDDRAFATAYNAALQLSKMVIAASGYRVIGQGHHQTTFQAMETALGPPAGVYAAYFETCRRKRNQVDYDMAQVISETEARELFSKAQEFRQFVESWLATHHPTLSR